MGTDIASDKITMRASIEKYIPFEYEYKVIGNPQELLTFDLFDQQKPDKVCVVDAGLCNAFILYMEYDLQSYTLEQPSPFPNSSPNVLSVSPEEFPLIEHNMVFLNDLTLLYDSTNKTSEKQQKHTVEVFATYSKYDSIDLFLSV